MTKPHAQAKPGSARPAQSASQKDILPLEQMMAHEVRSNLGADTQSEPQLVSNDSKDNVLVPALRFEGFKDLWSIHLAETIGSWKSGTTPNRANKMYWNNGTVNWLKTGELLDHEVTSIEEHITQYAINSCSLRINPIGSVLVAMYGATAGKIGLLSIPSTTNQACCACIVDPNKADNWFVFISFLVVRDGLLKTTDGSAQPNLNKQKIEQTKLIMPSLPEQQRIGTLFKELDRNLSLNRAQLDKLTQLKTSMLEQMFPQEGESVPRLRFDGFSGPWKQRQLRDVAQIIGGGTPSTSIKAYWDGSINWFTPAELGDQVFVSHSERQITQQGVEQSSAKLLPQGTVLFTSRAGIGKTAILAIPSTTNQGFQSIVPNPKLLDSYFIFSCTNQLKAYGENVGGGSTFKEVSGKQMEVMSLLIPSLAEQERIGAFFQALDERLALQRAKIEKLEQLKKALLEQMFV